MPIVMPWRCPFHGGTIPRATWLRMVLHLTTGDAEFTLECVQDFTTRHQVVVRELPNGSTVYPPLLNPEPFADRAAVLARTGGGRQTPPTTFLMSRAGRMAASKTTFTIVTRKRGT